MQLTASPDRHILLCLAGTSPAVITETLWALRDSDQFPQELHVVTTATGREALLNSLVGERSALDSLCTDYSLPRPAFVEEHVHVPAGQDGTPLEDIRSADDNTRMADILVSLVRRFTADPGSALHVSIAGGRKTMGFFGGYALSLLGRAQDRLSHVLVEPDFEHNPLFHYPTPYSHELTTRDNRIIDALDATVELVDIPFVRLRHLLPEQEHQSYSELVEAARPLTELPDLRIELAENTLVIGEAEVYLKPLDFLFYLWLIREGLDDQTLTRSGLNGVEREYFNRLYRTWCMNLMPQIRQTESTMKAQPSFESGWLGERRTRINSTLKNALGTAASEPYQVHILGKRGSQIYGLHELPADYLRQQLGSGIRHLALDLHSGS